MRCVTVEGSLFSTHKLTRFPSSFLQEKIAEYINNQLRLSQSEKALAALEQQIVGLKVDT